MTSGPTLSVRQQIIHFIFLYFVQVKYVQGLKLTGIYKFRVPISGIRSLGFCLAFDYKFNVCFGLFLLYMTADCLVDSRSLCVVNDQPVGNPKRKV
jgi:hypothetical protein